MIEIKGLNKTYRKNKSKNKIFDDLNLTINENDFVSIIGSNGSGKTTLLNCICGNIDIDSGKILINGEKINKLKDYERYKLIGRVYQDPSVGTCGNLTVLENLSLADNKGRSYDLTHCIDKNEIEYYKEKLKLLKMGLENKLDSLVNTLSGGQRQALALVMVALSDIEILILDEHTAALDPKTADIIMELTKKIIDDNHLTALMVTHNLKYALEYGNRLIIFDEGKIVNDMSGKEKANITQEKIFNIFNDFYM